MSTPSKEITEFCKLCSWAHSVWVIHKTFEDNLDATVMKLSKCPYVLTDLSSVTQEYSLLQIVKLHDPAVQKSKKNLTIEYVIQFGGWDKTTLSELNKLMKKLEELKNEIFTARNKVICHNDLETILNKTTHGEFRKGADIEYFNTLQEFVNIIYPPCYPLDDGQLKNDTEILVGIISGRIEPLFQKE